MSVYGEFDVASAFACCIREVSEILVLSGFPRIGQPLVGGSPVQTDDRTGVDQETVSCSMR